MNIDVIEVPRTEDGGFDTRALQERVEGLDVQGIEPVVLPAGDGPPTLALVVSWPGPGTGRAAPKTRDWRARLAEGDRPCFDALRQWRKVAAARDNVAAFIVMTNRVLAALAATRPQQEAELLSVPGVGPVTVERYGDEVLAVISEHVPDLAPAP